MAPRQAAKNLTAEKTLARKNKRKMWGSGTIDDK
jgi:hypothetical protein